MALDPFISRHPSLYAVADGDTSHKLCPSLPGFERAVVASNSTAAFIPGPIPLRFVKRIAAGPGSAVSKLKLNGVDVTSVRSEGALQKWIKDAYKASPLIPSAFLFSVSSPRHPMYLPLLVSSVPAISITAKDDDALFITFSSQPLSTWEDNIALTAVFTPKTANHHAALYMSRRSLPSITYRDSSGTDNELKVPRPLGSITFDVAFDEVHGPQLFVSYGSRRLMAQLPYHYTYLAVGVDAEPVDFTVECQSRPKIFVRDEYLSVYPIAPTTSIKAADPVFTANAQVRRYCITSQ